MQDWYASSGEYQILVGESSADIRLTASLQFTTNKQLPFVGTLNTPICQLISHPKLEKAAKEFTKDFCPTGSPNQSETASSAITAEMALQTFLSSPLRGLRSFSGIPTETLLKQVEEFNRLLNS